MRNRPNNQNIRYNQSSAFRPNRSDKMSLRFVIPLVLFFLVVGALLIWLESLVTTIASYVLAIALLSVGGFLLIRYLRSAPEDRISGMDLAFGLILLMAGILLAFNPKDLDGLFPKIWGLSLIFGGFLKIQYAFDEKTVRVKRWWIMLIFAALSLIVGILALFQKSIFGEGNHLVIGIFMLCEAGLDLVTYFLISSGMKKHAAEKEAAFLAAQAHVNVPAPADVPTAEIPTTTEEE